MGELARSAAGQRIYNQSISGRLVFTAATTTTTLVTARNATSTIFIQRIIVTFTTDAAQSLTFQDSAGIPVGQAKVPISPGVNTHWHWDFDDTGAGLTEGKDFVAAFSAAGLAGHIEWEGYTRLTSPMAIGPTN